MLLRPIIPPLAALSLALCGPLLAGCQDSDYSFDNIDATVGLGSDSIVLPGDNSTKDIALDDVVSLNNSNFVHIAGNGDYEVLVEGNGSYSSTLSVDRFVIRPSAQSGGSVPLVAGTFSGELATATLRASVPTEVSALTLAGCDATATVTYSVPGTVSQIDALTFSFPSWMHMDRATADGAPVTVSGSSVTQRSVRPGQHTLALHFSSIAFGQNGGRMGSATFDAAAHQAVVKCVVWADATLSAGHVSGSGGLKSLTGDMTVGNVNVTTATGRFHPVFAFNGFGTVQIGRLPDFLTDSGVCLDLYDPHINLHFNSTLPVDALVSGTLVSRDAAGRTLARVAVPQFAVPAGQSVVVLHKQGEGAPAGQAYVSVPALGELLKTIPHHIDFEGISAEVDETKTCEVQLGHDYSMSEQYAFATPLQFDTDAVIAYTDSLTDLNKTVKKLSFKETKTDGKTTINGRLVLEADVTNRLPAYLSITAWGVDLQGDSISQKALSVTVDKTVTAATDAEPEPSTHVTVTLRPADNSVLQRLDALHIHFKATAKGDDGNVVVGKTLNAKTQTITVKNARLTAKGHLVGNFN